MPKNPGLFTKCYGGWGGSLRDECEEGVEYKDGTIDELPK